MLSVLIFSLAAHAQVKCDLRNQLKGVAIPTIQGKSLSQQMMDESKSQQAAIDKLTQEKVKDAYDVYMNSPAGKKSNATIEKLKADMGYDAVSYYLFDNASFNADVEPYDVKVLHQGKTYYFLQGQIIAILEADQNTWVLKRFDKDCSQKEAVGFVSMDTSDESHLDYKINSKLCELLKGSKTIGKIPEKQIEKVNAMVNSTVDDANALRNRNRQVQGQCRLMSSTSGVSKSGTSDSKAVKRTN